MFRLRKSVDTAEPSRSELLARAISPEGTGAFVGGFLHLWCGPAERDDQVHSTRMRARCQADEAPSLLWRDCRSGSIASIKPAKTSGAALNCFISELFIVARPHRKRSFFELVDFT